MTTLQIYFINKTDSVSLNPKIKTVQSKKGKNIIKLILNIFNLSNYEITNNIYKLKNIINMYNQIKKFNILFININELILNMIITKLNNILYNYHPTIKKIKLYCVDDNSNNIIKSNNLTKLMDEINKYKNIVMDPNKNPDTYLNFIKSNVPPNYMFTCKTLMDDKIFPLTFSVGMGTNFKSYFVQISPNNPNPNNLDVFLVGKAVTYDAGGLNIKTKNMEKMKTDMTGSALLLSVLRLLSANNVDSNLNIYLLIPIVENMTSSKATKPGTVIKSMNGKKVEIVNTDAEGRLCIADCIEWINTKLITKPSKSLIIDVATLTGSARNITNGISSIIMSNDIGFKYAKQLINTGENVQEYLDYIKIRKNHTEFLKTPVADIANLDNENKAGCVIGGTFIYYFTDESIPWIHIDLGDTTFDSTTSISTSYGINLLYEYFKGLNIKID
jgi:leucyl aminopeptidase